MTDKQKVLALIETNFKCPEALAYDYRYRALWRMAKWFATRIADRCPVSRELSLALTNLENTVMWAIAAIDRNQTKSKEDSSS